MKRVSSLLFALLLLPFALSAQQPQEPRLPSPLPSQQTGPVLVQQMDKDGDKKVSRKEFLKAAEERAEKQFQRLDANYDGFISINEENKARDQAMQLMHKQMDGARALSTPPKN